MNNGVPSDGEQGAAWLIAAAAIALALLVGLVLLRTLSRGKAEVKLTDAAIALVPIVVALFATGQISKLTIGPEGLGIERAREAILEAAALPLAGPLGSLDRIDPEPIEAAQKGGPSLISEYAARGVQALTFQIGGNYVADLIRQYLTQLSASPRFRYVVLTEGDTFYGMIEAGKLIAYVGREPENPEAPDWSTIERWIEGDPKAFRRLSGFVGQDQALTTGTNKRDALARLEDQDAAWLPVVDEQGRLAGVVDRSRLTASLILDVANQLSRPDGEPRPSR